MIGSSSSSSDGNNTGILAGIIGGIVAVIVVIIIVIIICVVVCHRRKGSVKQKNQCLSHVYVYIDANDYRKETFQRYVCKYICSSLLKIFSYAFICVELLKLS